MKFSKACLIAGYLAYPILIVLSSCRRKPTVKNQLISFLVYFLGLPVEVAKRVFLMRFKNPYQVFIANADRYVGISIIEEAPMLMVLSVCLMKRGTAMGAPEMVKLAMTYLFYCVNVGRWPNENRTLVLTMPIPVIICIINIYLFFVFE